MYRLVGDAYVRVHARSVALRDVFGGTGQRLAAAAIIKTVANLHATRTRDRAAEIGAATLYRRFRTKDALVREVLATFFGQLVELAGQALTEPPQRCLDVYLETVGYQLAAKRGFMHGMWGKLAPAELVAELEARTGRLLDRARHGGGIQQSVTVADIAATIWALRGIIHTAGQTAPDAWRRHVGYVLAGLREPSSAAPTP